MNSNTIPVVRRRSWTTPYVSALVVLAIALRFFAPKRLWRGISAGRWAAFLGTAASGIKDWLVRNGDFSAAICENQVMTDGAPAEPRWEALPAARRTSRLYAI
jgi:hypothetical protein